MPSDGKTESAVAARDRTVLVVDDDAGQRAAVAELLSARGYLVVVASDGLDAMELLEQGVRPSVIVLDLTMPRMDGWAFLAYLRDEAHSEVPVVVTSAVGRDRPPAGADACLEKPFEAAQLRAAIARLSAKV